ncbi:MAG: SRPBCC family protein [Solirubrobacteraceae bacterium]
MSSAKGLALGAGLAALAPLAVKGAGKLANAAGVDGLGDLPDSPKDAVEAFASGLGDRAKGAIGEQVKHVGGPVGLLKKGLVDALPFGGGGGDDDDQRSGKNEARGVGKGRRMPVQQSVDIGAPIETVYNQWTQYEDWPNFMHRVTGVTQEDDCTVSITTRIWGRTKQFKAQIETQRPDEQVKWRVAEGIKHAGVVSFHELGPRLTRVLLGMDVEPGFPLEKAARGLRHVKRAARGDLHRFKAFVEMSGQETGAWRGVIENHEVVEGHDSGYDRQREYADVDELVRGDHEQSKRAVAQSRGSKTRTPARRSRSSSSSSRGRARGNHAH